MASAPIYCTHKELKRVFPQLDEYDQKTPIYGWETTGVSNFYKSYNTGLITVLFFDGIEGTAVSDDPNANYEFRYSEGNDSVEVYIDTGNPLDMLMEAGEDFISMVTQFRTDASRYLDSRLDPKLPKNMWKNEAGEFDYMIVRTTALYAAGFMVRTKDPTSDIAAALILEADNNVQLLNEGRAALSWQNTGDASKGIIRDVTYTDGKLRPVDLRGIAGAVDYDRVKIQIISGGSGFGTDTYSVWIKDTEQLKNKQVVTAEKITGDYQKLAYGLEVRFGGNDENDTAQANDEWEVEVRGYNEEVDTADLKGIKMTRRRYYGGRY
jgi:hypothetical protein